MADYYSLLSRAIGALPQSAPEARQAVYERARKALFNQLRSIQPPVAEADIEAEGRALDEAIARLELEIVKEPTGPANTHRDPGQEPGASAEPADERAEDAPSSGSLGPDAQPQRPAAPLPSAPEPVSNSRRMLTIAAVLLVVVGLVATLAWQLRETPEDLAKLKPEPSESAETEEGGKIADRIEGGESSSPTSGVRSTSEAAPPAPTVAVAQKAELWVSAPEEPSKVKTYPGTVVWRLDSVAAGPGQPVAPAIRGDVEMPSLRLKLALVFQKNLDPTLSASHTINVSFQLPATGDLKGVKAIGPIQMRRPEAQSGEQVAGVPVPITDNNFLIGLLRGPREARNLTLLRSPMVVDLPMQLADGRAATISLEKGPGGERVFADAIDAWARK